MKRFLLFWAVFFSALPFFSQSKDSIKTKDIKEVTLKAKKKPIEQTEKGIVLNVSGTDLEKKGSAMEVLAFAPNVSQVNGLEVLGSDSFQLILNGKEVKISKTQLKTFLTSINSAAIKSIEINDKPDASLDSKYTSQIIITTKKVEGIEASLSVESNYRGKFGDGANGSFIATTDKLRIYATGNFFEAYSKFKGNNKMDIENTILRTGTLDGTLKRLGYSATLNLDYDFNDKNKISFLYDHVTDKDLDKEFNYHYRFTGSAITDSTAEVRNRFENLDDTNTLSLQYIYTPDDRGSSLTINTDYATDDFRIPFRSFGDYYNTNHHSALDFSQNTQLAYRIFTSSMDYKKVFNDQHHLDLGLKYTYSSNLNILDYYEGNVFVYDNSQHFNLYENIYAAYLKYILKSGKFTYTLGVRNEYTDDRFRTNRGITGNQNYNNFLPSVMASYGINKNNSIYFSLSKTMQRPSFFSYDPTVFFMPPNEQFSGNENLKPVLTYKAQSGYTFKQKYSLLLQYSYSIDNIITIPKVIENSIIFSKPENGGFQNRFLVNMSIPVKFAKFWESYNKFNLIYQDFRIPETSDFYKSNYFSGESTQSFKLPSDIAVDVSFSYTSPYRSRYNYFYGNFSSSIFVIIPILKGDARIRTGVSDIFNTERSKYYSDINGVYKYDYMKFNTREVYLSFTYFFRSGKEVDDDLRDTGLQEQLMRTGK